MKPSSLLLPIPLLLLSSCGSEPAQRAAQPQAAPVAVRTATGQRYASFTSANSTTYTAPYLPSVEVTVVPEPSSSMLVMVGLAAITCFLKKRQARCQGKRGGHWNSTR